MKDHTGADIRSAIEICVIKFTRSVHRRHFYLQSAVFQDLAADLNHLPVMHPNLVGRECETYRMDNGEQVLGEEGEPTWCGRMWMGFSDPTCNATDDSCRGLVHSHLHRDADHNFHVVVAGRKRFNMVHPDETARLKVDPKHLRSSWLDLRTKNAIPRQGCTVYPGEVIFIPANWWHDVLTAPGRNMGLNWWQTAGSETTDPDKLCSVENFPSCDSCIAAGCAYCRDTQSCVAERQGACRGGAHQHVALDRYPWVRSFCHDDNREERYMRQLSVEMREAEEEQKEDKGSHMQDMLLADIRRQRKEQLEARAGRRASKTKKKSKKTKSKAPKGTRNGPGAGGGGAGSGASQGEL